MSSNEVESLRLRITNIENDIAEVKNKIKKHNTTIDSLTDKLGITKDAEERKDLQKQVEILQKQADGLRLDIDGLREDRRSLETQLSNLKQSVSESKTSPKPKIAFLSELHSPRYPFRFKNFQQRNFDSVNQVGTMNYNNYQREELSRQDISFLSIFGGAGIGKTRTALQIGKYLRKNMDGFSSAIEIYIDFSNGDKLQTSETKFDKILGMRLISRCLFQKSVKDFIESKLISEDDLSRYSVGEAMKEIRWNLCDSKIIGEDDVLPIVIIMDEYQEVMERKDWKNIGKSLLEYIQSSSKKDKFIVIPIFVGTLLPMEDFSLTGFNQVSFQMDPLSKKQIMNLLMGEIDDETFFSITDIKKLVFQMKNVIRILEYFVESYENEWKKSKSIEKFVAYIFTLFDTKYGGYYRALLYDKKLTPIGEKIFHYIVTGNSASQKDEDISDLIKKGIITLNRSSQILIPFPYFYKLINESGKMTKNYFSIPFAMDSESFEEIFLEILSYKLTKGYSIGNTLKLEDLFHGAYMSPNLKNLMVKTQKHVSYVFEKDWYYKDGKIIEKSEITALYPNTPYQICVRKDEFEEYIFKAPKDHTSIDGRAFASAYKSKHYESYEFLLQNKQKKEIKESIQLTNPSPQEWAHAMDRIIEKSSFTKTLPIKVFLTSAKLDVQACKNIVISVENMIILDKSGLKKFLSPQMYYGFGNDESK
jgi:hypothetical protein